ncbi:SURF1 family cytochrome oxidase biogenesis protein [Cryobacterium frigoriphilum]|nr:SURF1 family cytochrome oxidase biogenesis protein [Cryobacterium frigoriphilum]
MMVRPRWVLALLLALAIAAAFAVLGHWQLERAIASGVVVERTTELVTPLGDVVQPDGPVEQVATGQMITASGYYVAGDEELVGQRFNGDTLGYWVVSHFVTAQGSSIAVARGWAEHEGDARAALAALATDADNTAGLLNAPENYAPSTLTGRFLPGEAPELPDEQGDPYAMNTVAPATLINLWADFTDQSVYFGYVVDTEAAPGLAVIDSPIPVVEKELNWLNIFYAIEWAVFAGFAVYIWYRLVRDAVEREEEDAADAALAEAAADEEPSTGHPAVSHAPAP